MNNIAATSARILCPRISRTALAAAKRNLAGVSPFRTVVLPVGNVARHYATESSGKKKVVQYTVDNFPGYVRNENFKKVI